MTRTEALDALEKATRNFLNAPYSSDNYDHKHAVRILANALAALDAAEPDGWRHKKRGTTYRIVGESSVQADEPIREGDAVIVYRADSDGSLWVRRKDKFFDGRFERVTPPPPPTTSDENEG